MQDQKIIHDTYELFIELGAESQKILKTAQSRVAVLSYKNGDALDIVTNADMDIENLCFPKIGAIRPKFNIISEENGDHENDSEWTVYLDAVDGTKNLAWGIPLFASSIALQHNDEIVAGVISTPNEIYTAIKGEGASLNGKKMRVSKEKDLSKTIAILDTPQKKNLTNDEFYLMSKRRERIDAHLYRTREYGCGSLELCYIANGMPAAYFDSTGKEPLYDVAAGLLMVQEAGGKISNILGDKIAHSANYAVASNGLVHKAFLRLLNEQ